MTYRTYWWLPAYVVALALNGCSGIAPLAASPDTEAPPWNSLEMIMMDTEIVLIDHPGQKAENIELLSALQIAVGRLTL